MKLKSMIILCGLVAAGCAACSREIQPAGERNIPEGQVRVVMPVQAGQMACVTRAADEDTVNDLNVYLFDAYSRSWNLIASRETTNSMSSPMPMPTWGNCSMRKLLTGR